MPACSKGSVAGLADSLQRLVSRYGPGICPPGQGWTAFLAPVCEAYFLCQFGGYGRLPVPAPLGDRNERSMALYNHPGLEMSRGPQRFRRRPLPWYFRCLVFWRPDFGGNGEMHHSCPLRTSNHDSADVSSTMLFFLGALRYH